MPAFGEDVPRGCRSHGTKLCHRQLGFERLCHGVWELFSNLSLLFLGKDGLLGQACSGSHTVMFFQVKGVGQISEDKKANGRTSREKQ